MYIYIAYIFIYSLYLYINIYKYGILITCARFHWLTFPLKTTAPAKTATNTEPNKKKIQSNTCTRRSESTLRDETKEMQRPTVTRYIPDQRCMCNRQIYSRPLKSIHHSLSCTNPATPEDSII